MASDGTPKKACSVPGDMQTALRRTRGRHLAGIFGGEKLARGCGWSRLGEDAHRGAMCGGSSAPIGLRSASDGECVLSPAVGLLQLTSTRRAGLLGRVATGETILRVRQTCGWTVQ